ncbi:MAG: 16S rRNA (guanine(966)-N(2))-methyltransferase RsmD [bacterium]
MALRIIGGSARGRRLASPPGKNVRPTGDRVREALFNILGQRLDGWRFLDVCAGSGAVSLEALSRGAVCAVALEWDADRCRHIREEAGRVNLDIGLEVRCEEALAGLSRLRREGGPAFDLAFLDPPWDSEGLRQEILDILFEEPGLCGAAVAEFPSEGKAPDAPPAARMIRRADYGGTSLMFFEAENSIR